ncbi:hypothetical protein COCNU_07G015750 [Cocos nucifera]|uniref:Uncharacterized protein n=1 Tax=Cocos nucifera TaxID=13894 RepID=A0A8K0IGQ9_COCNU|nr:hypothetical protein COCNU_07G015750 [Cocos nucifera]
MPGIKWRKARNPSGSSSSPQVNVMLKEFPEAEFGPRIDFREYSFLQNPLVPKEVKESLLEVQLCDDRSAKCQTANETTRRGVLRFPKHSTQQMVVAYAT